MKRIVLFVVTNLAVMLVLSIVLKLLGLDRAMYSQTGISYGGLLAASVVVGFTGSIISLLISKPMAKWSTGAHVIEQPSSEPEAWLVETVRKLATTAGIGMPEVAIYEGAPNAFATGAFKNSALVAVSTGLLQSMNKEEVEAVLGHEIAHVANGDMVTLTLIQGVVNTFVFFFARIIGTIVDKAVFKTERGTGPGYFITVIVAQIVLGARVPRRRRIGEVPWHAVADGECAAAPRRARGGRVAEGDERLRHHRQGRRDGALLDAPADRGAHRRAFRTAMIARGRRSGAAVTARPDRRNRR